MFGLIKSLVVLTVVVGSAAAGYLYFAAPEQVYCHRTLTLCDVQLKGADETCIESVAGIAQSTPDVARAAAICAVQSDSCLDVMGCLPKAGFERLNKLLPKLGEPKSGLDKVLDKTDDLIDKTDDLINKTREKAKRLLED